MKTKTRITSTQFIIIGVLILFITCCTKSDDTNDATGNPIQTNSLVVSALSQAGITTYDGNSPPVLQGTYSTTQMKCYNATGTLSFLIGQNMTTVCKFYDQTSAGQISFAEQISPDLFAEGKGCYITGSGQNFTIWMENSLSNGAATAFVLSGTLDQATGNLLNCKSVTVYTKSSGSYNAGDWYAHSGWLKKEVGGNTQCACTSYEVQICVYYVPYNATERRFGVGYKTPNQTECQKGTVIYNFNINQPSLTADLQTLGSSGRLRGYTEFVIPIGQVPYTITAYLTLENGTTCVHTKTFSNK
jgi:hypothetical protein